MVECGNSAWACKDEVEDDTAAVAAIEVAAERRLSPSLSAIEAKRSSLSLSSEKCGG